MGAVETRVVWRWVQIERASTPLSDVDDAHESLHESLYDSLYESLTRFIMRVTIRVIIHRSWALVAVHRQLGVTFVSALFLLGWEMPSSGRTEGMCQRRG